MALVWHKRRWRCRERACPRASFTESIPQVPARARVMARVRTECGAGIAERFSCVAAGAGHYGISWRIAHAAYVAHVDPPLAAPLPPVRVLGIDETRRGRLKWAQDPLTHRWTVVADRWHTGIVDASGTGGLLAHIDGRAAAQVTAWIKAQPQAWRDGITHVAIDLSASYAKAVADALPDAVVVADRFHLIALAGDMLTEVRQHATGRVRGRRGRRRDPEWANRRRLLTGHERLSARSFTRMWNQLIDAGDPGVEVLLAYAVKENLRQLLALAGTDPDRSQIRDRLWAFYDLAAASRSPEVHRLATTIEAWWPAVEAGITTGYSDARSEGYNRLAKHQGRNAFGFRTWTITAAGYGGLHPPAPAAVGHPQRGARLSSKSPQALDRRWIGIDITHLVTNLIKTRLLDLFPGATYDVIGEPVTAEEAEQLAREDPYQFQWWALGLLGARPLENKKGADAGIDGKLFFHDDSRGNTKQMLFSVKSGGLKLSDVRDLRGVIEREHAEIGVLVTLKATTEKMRAEAC